MVLSRVILGASVLCASFASYAHAYHKGDMVVKVGVTGLHADDSGEIRNNGVAFDGSQIDLRKDVVLGANFTYFLHDNIGVELGIDNDYNVVMKGENFSVPEIGAFKVFLPTLTVNYYPKFSNVKWAKPYAGFGVSYARFTDERLSLAFTNFTNERGVPNMEEDWGWVVKGGIDFPMRNHWLLGMEFTYHQLDSHWNVRHVNNQYAADFNLDAFQWLFSVGYQF